MAPNKQCVGGTIQWVAPIQNRESVWVPQDGNTSVRVTAGERNLYVKLVKVKQKASEVQTEIYFLGIVVLVYDVMLVTYKQSLVFWVIF